MSLMFCAQIVGNPVRAPEPTERPVRAAPLCKTRRRETALVLRCAFVPVVCSLIPCSSAWAVGERSSARSLGSPAHVVAAVHQRQDAGAELLHADNKIVKGQHHA